MKNILEYLEQTAKRLPEKIAFSNGKENLTFSKLLNDAKSIGSALLQRNLFGKPIAILMEKHPNEISAFFGCIYAGCFYVAIDPDMPPMRMEKILESVQTDLIVTDKKHQSTANSLHFAGKIVPSEELSKCEIDETALQNIREKQIDTDPIYIVFTSGSTGTPKGVCACHRSVIDYTEALCKAIPFSESQIFGNQTPLFFDAPLKEIMPTVKYGATTYLIPKINFLFPIKLCEFLNEYRINTVCWVVSALTMISSLGCLEKNPPKYLTTVCFGSEVFPRRQYDLWRNAYPQASFFNLYGPTEATGMSCFWKARELSPDEPIPVGRPFDNTGLFLLKEDGTEAKSGESGEIYLRGTCVTLGYYNNPEKTNEAFVQNPLQSHYPELVYKTGDLGYFNEKGELVFQCRKDAQIKHMGHRIELGEIEAATAENESVTRACCIYREEEKQIALFYTGTAIESDLLEYLKGYLPRYMIPTEIHRMDSMPLTPNGKLDRRKLAEK